MHTRRLSTPAVSYDGTRLVVCWPASTEPSGALVYVYDDSYDG